MYLNYYNKAGLTPLGLSLMEYKKEKRLKEEEIRKQNEKERALISYSLGDLSPLINSTRAAGAGSGAVTGTSAGGAGVAGAVTTVAVYDRHSKKHSKSKRHYGYGTSGMNIYRRVDQIKRIGAKQQLRLQS